MKSLATPARNELTVSRRFLPIIDPLPREKSRMNPIRALWALCLNAAIDDYNVSHSLYIRTRDQYFKYQDAYGEDPSDNNDLLLRAYQAAVRVSFVTTEAAFNDICQLHPSANPESQPVGKRSQLEKALRVVREQMHAVREAFQLDTGAWED